MEAASHQNPTFTYPLSPRRRFFLYIVATFFLFIPSIFLITGIVTPEKDLVGAGIVIGLIMLPFAAFVLFCARFPKVTASSEGLSFRGNIGFGSYTVPWSTIERLRLRPGSEGIILNTPLQIRAAQSWKDWSGVRIRGAAFYDDEQRAYIQDACYVPFEPFAWWFEHGTLLNAFRMYAPSIVQNFEDERKSARIQNEMDRKVLIGVLVVTGVITVLAIIAGFYSEELSKLDYPVLFAIGNASVLVLGYVVGAAICLYGIINLQASYHFLRQRKIFLALFWLAAAVVQILSGILLFATGL